MPDFSGLPTDQRPDDPQDAFYYVYRRLQGPNGNVVFETLDHAFVEGKGDNRRVVTASYPYSGYVTSFGSVDAQGNLTSTGPAYALLMWSYQPLLLRKPLPGVITGKVLRVKWNPGVEIPEYEGVPNAVVSGVDNAGQPLFAAQSRATAAVSQGDGTFALYDPKYTGGVVTVSAMVAGTSRPRGRGPTPRSTPRR